MSNRIDAYAGALADIAEAEGVIAVVDRELHAAASAFESNEQLRSALTDQGIPADRRQAILEKLLGNRFHPLTAQLIGMVVGAGRGRDLPEIAAKFGQRTASSQGHNVAEVRSAVALTEDQQNRLADALAKKTGAPVNLRVVVDPKVVGGLVATVGDIVIDGSIRTNLDQLKSRLS
jgi:F-type H+-transporting ATPase subunit delta